MKNPEIEKRIKDLLSKMTLEEKAGQLHQAGGSIVGAFDLSLEEILTMVQDGRMTEEEAHKMISDAKRDWHEDDLRAGRIGSYLGLVGSEEMNRMQHIAVEETRLGIPLINGFDVIHGFRTITPIPLAESCAWEPDLWERTARMSAEEAAAAGIHMTFSPMVDVSKDPRWGRIAESAGEDALLNGLYGEAKVKGYQTDDLTRHDALAACVKHFAAYGAAEGGRDYNRVDMSPQRFEEEYLPSYERAVKAGARAVMPAFNDLSGVPCSVNKKLLTDILRRRWGFDGMTISDANAIAECINHGIAADRRDAARQALNAGMDMDMTSGCFLDHVKELVETGEVPMERLDEAVSDILRLKFELGLFDDPYRSSPEKEKAVMLTPAHRALAREAAQRSMVLLKNDGLLPLKAGLRIALAGKLAYERDEMSGTWAGAVQPGDCKSIRDGLDEEGIAYQAVKDDQPLPDCDVFLCAIGESKAESGEAASRASLELTNEDAALLKRLKGSGKPVAAVVFAGRPLCLKPAAEYADAILMAWHPGAEAGPAILDLLWGRVNPSAKLTAGFPEATGQCPALYYDHIRTGRPAGKFKYTSKYLDAPVEPMFPFGWGLSYTSFQYSDISAAQTEDGIHSEITVQNTGGRAGDEIVQCYFRDPVARRVRPVRKLAAFEKVALQPGESKRIAFDIPKAALGYYDQDMNFVIDDGLIEIHIGGNVRDTLQAEVHYIQKK
ncbi:MAG: glycoside hydrolase family 3 C-terminal domain-containing protein [Clostridia bacterium]|nr:glycoside hydrolase family 3 C-terminal domain-containing protein [Clostridia bacterium]